MLATRFLRLLVISLALPCSSAFAAERPNILFIFSDDQGMNDVSCYGSEIPTPHIDSIARNGVKLESFYVASPICTPSRFGLLTGRYPNRSRDNLLGALMFLRERDDQRGIRAGETTFASLLKKSGYRTGLIGKWHLGHGLPEFAPDQHGFDYHYGTSGGCIDYFTMKYGHKPDWFRNGRALQEQGYSTDLLSEDAVRFLEEQEPKKPFFLYLAYTAPHYGKGWDEETKKLSNILQAKDSDRQRFAHLKDEGRREFAGMVAAMDDGIGRVLEALRRQKLEKNTLVIFACDNGADPRYGGSNKPFRGQKAQLFEGGIRVPCVMQWPAKLKKGHVIWEPVIGLDFFPTFCELAGIGMKDMESDGVSLKALLLKGKTAPRDLLWQLPNADALRRGDWKYLRSGKEEFLFNLADDPWEKNNLARGKPGMVRELKAAHATVTGTFPQR